MTPHTELDRLFAQVFPEIPKPNPLESTTVMRVSHDGQKFQVEEIPMRRFYLNPTDPVDADEAVHGVCAQGDCDGV